MVLNIIPPCRNCGGDGWHRLPDPAGRGDTVRCEACNPEPPKAPDPITTALADELRVRAALGLRKYGVGVTNAPLNRRQWLQHAKEEALDLAVYLQRLIDMEPSA